MSDERARTSRHKEDFAMSPPQQVIKSTRSMELSAHEFVDKLNPKVVEGLIYRKTGFTAAGAGASDKNWRLDCQGRTSKQFPTSSTATTEEARGSSSHQGRTTRSAGVGSNQVSRPQHLHCPDDSQIRTLITFVVQGDSILQCTATDQFHLRIQDAGL